MKKRKFILFSTIFLILFLSAGYLVTNDIISSGMTIAGWGLLSLVSFLLIKKWDGNIIVATIISVFFFAFSSYYNQEPLFRTIALVFAFFTAGLLSMSFNIEVFKEIYIKVMLVLSSVSVVCFFLYKIVPELSEINVVYNSVRLPASNLIVYIGNNYDRNMGMFWEPGAFQAFISLALFFSILKPVINYKHIFLFVVTIITTFSTTGYLSVLIVAIMISFRWKTIDKKTRKYFVYLAIPVFLLFLYVSAGMLLDTSSNSVFGKLLSFREQGGMQGQVEEGSVAIRYFAIIKPIQSFFDSPLFGKGYEGLNLELMYYTRGMNTCTFINWFAMYGIGFGIPLLLGLFRFSKKTYPEHMWLGLFFLFIITISENFATNAFFFMLAMIGYKPNERIRIKPHIKKVNNGYVSNHTNL